MDRLILENVPVHLQATVSPEYYAKVEAEARERLDLQSLLWGKIQHGQAWADAEWVRRGGPRLKGDFKARAQLEGGRVTLRAAGVSAQCGQPLRALLLQLQDGRVTAIKGVGHGA